MKRALALKWSKWMQKMLFARIAVKFKSNEPKKKQNAKFVKCSFQTKPNKEYNENVLIAEWLSNVAILTTIFSVQIKQRNVSLKWVVFGCKEIADNDDPGDECFWSNDDVFQAWPTWLPEPEVYTVTRFCSLTPDVIASDEREDENEDVGGGDGWHLRRTAGGG